MTEAESCLSRARGGITHGRDGTLEWYWYHMGSGHHFATCCAPPDWEEFFTDPAWLRLNEGLLHSLAREGFRFITVTDFARAMEGYEATALPAVVEGSWNSERSRGVFTWMGKQEQPWENDPAILGLAWRARSELLQCEELLSTVADSVRRSRLSGYLEKAWKSQLLAESSDALGWMPLPDETSFAKRAAERVLKIVGAVEDEIRRIDSKDGPLAELRNDLVQAHTERNARPLVAAELFGAKGTLSVVEIRRELQLFEADFQAIRRRCGVRFSWKPGEIVYCPTGMEMEPVRIRIEDLSPAVIYLPLANGLLGLEDGLYLIRDNAHGQVAAEIEKGQRWVSFAIEGSPRLRAYRWRFYLFRGGVEAAVQLANEINRV